MLRLLVALAGLCFTACGYPHPAGVADGNGPGDDDDAPASGIDTMPAPDMRMVDAYVPDAYVPDAWTTCYCSGATLMCPSGNTACAASCLSTPQAHCAQLIPSNTVDRTMLSQVSTTITIAATTTIDTGTGQISGGITRAPGTGVTAGILYSQVGSLGVFVFDGLAINSAITLNVIGTRPAVFLVAKTVTVDGIIDVSGDHGSISQPGAGGGVGGVGTTVAGGCSPGGPGNHATASGVYSDSGGGGGGAGAVGARGGMAAAQSGGTAGSACIPLTLEPLVGGSGGGVGALGTAARQAYGGGGGGALQISSLSGITIAGTIDLGGSGGEGGQGDTSGSVHNAGGGGGGGGGGALLLEAPVVTLMASGVIAANGGAGGGAADSSTNGTTGADGARSASVAAGGAGVGGGTKGGNGGAGGTGASQGGDTADNSLNTGGGGGGAGLIFIRAHSTPTLSGVVSPTATAGAWRAD